MKVQHRLFFLAFPLFISCNVFGPIDNPTSDPQHLSAARACFDQGDLACAKEHYQKLGAGSSDTAISESAFALLDEQGASLSAFLQFVGNSGCDGCSGGTALTKLAELLSPGAGEAKRLAIYEAFKKRNDIQDAKLRAFVQFLAGLSLAAEILGEATGADGSLKKTEVVFASGCEITTCAAATACDAPSSSVIKDTASGDLSTSTPSGTSPTLDELFDAINYTYSALQSLSASGNLSSSSEGFQQILTVGRPSDNPVAKGRCFRAQLLGFGIGG